MTEQTPPVPSHVVPPPPAPGTVPPPPGQPGAQYVQQVYVQANDKSTGVAYLLWFFLGVLGVHHFYLGKIGRGVGYLLTLGWLTIGLWIDLFTLPSQVRAVNAQRRTGVR